MRRLYFALLLAAMCAVGRTAGATVTTSLRSVTYTGSGGSTFSVTYPFTATDQLKVTKTTIATGTKVVLTQGVDYTVRLPSGSAVLGAVVTTATISNAYRITVDRIVPLTQTTNFTTQGSYLPKTHEDAFDKLTMEVQQLGAGAVSSTDITAAIDSHVAAADPHTGYALLAGRSGGQHLRGGTAAANNLQLTPNSAASSGANAGKLLLGGDALSAYDDNTNFLGVGTASPAARLDVNGDVLLGASTPRLRLDSGIAWIKSDTDCDSLFVGAYDAAGINSGGSIQAFVPACAAKPKWLELRGTSVRILPAGVSPTPIAKFDSIGLAMSANETIVLSDDVNSWVQTRKILGGTAAGDNVVIQTTDNATKGKVFIGSAGTELVVDDVNDRVGIGVAAPSSTLEVNGTIAGDRRWAVSGATTTLSAAVDCNGYFLVNADGGVVNLPPLSAVTGCQVTVVNTNAVGNGVQLQPDAGSGDSISGTVGAVTLAGGAGIRICNTKATAVHNDYVTVVPTSANEWGIIGGVGVWKAAACP